MDEILNTKQAGDFLQISRQLLMKQIAENGLPGRKVGRCWRFSRRALIEWIEAGEALKDDDKQPPKTKN